MLLKNCRYIITQNRDRKVLENYDISTEKNTISQIAKNLIAQREEEIIDCSNKIVMPGLINTHTHLGMHSLRGMCDDKELFEWLLELEKAEKKLTAKEVRENTLAGLEESIRFGTTTIYDSYKSPQERVEAFEKTGMRGVISSTVYDETTLNQSKKFLSQLKSKLITGAIAANSAYKCSEEIIRKVVDYSNEKNMLRRIHVAETRKERFDVLDKKKKLAIEYLESTGFLGKNALLVHCIWITKSEIKKIAKTNSKVSHNPISNMKLSSGGVMPLFEMLEEKITVGLGTDSVASNNNLDIFEEMKFCALLHKHHKWNADAISAQKILDMATINAAKCLGLEKIGAIEKSNKADIITLEIAENLKPVNDVISNIVYSAQGGNVTDVIIDGKILLQNKKFAII